MALPPEPLDDVLRCATMIVEAEVTGVRDLERWPVDPKNGPVDAAADRPAQEVTLHIARVLRGDAAAHDIVVKKPPSAYVLRVGVRGAFLVDTGSMLLGRYG